MPADQLFDAPINTSINASINAQIDALIRRLAKHNSSITVANPYRKPELANNLRCYLRAIARLPGKPLLLVGEALGYKGGKLTGIPFSSGDIFQRFDHPFLQQLAPQLQINIRESENTATIVWEYFTNQQITPLCWNAFPFHPHLPRRYQTNRAPNTAEVNLGSEYLQQLADIFAPIHIAGVGNKGFAAAQQAFPETNITKLRHPSFGGKTAFISGMDSLCK